MATTFSLSSPTDGSRNLRRMGSLLLVAAALSAIVVHGKTGRGPKPMLVEVADMVRFADRPQAH